MEQAIMALLILLIVIGFPFVFIECSDRNEEKKKKEREISYAKKNIKREFDTITYLLDKEIIDWLNKCAEKLRKMSTDKDIIDNIKPYDEIKLDKPKKYSIDNFKIKVDKNLVPKFAPGEVYYFSEKNKIDYELEACMDLKELEAFIEMCKVKLMNKEIEAHRKRIIENKLK